MNHDILDPGRTGFAIEAGASFVHATLWVMCETLQFKTLGICYVVMSTEPGINAPGFL